MTNQYNHPNPSLKPKYGANKGHNGSNKFQCNRNYSPLFETYSALRKGSVNHTIPYHHAEPTIEHSPKLGSIYQRIFMLANPFIDNINANLHTRSLSSMVKTNLHPAGEIPPEIEGVKQIDPYPTLGKGYFNHTIKNYLLNTPIFRHNDPTTLLAVKPSRHLLAIFVPNICGYYPQNTTGTNMPKLWASHILDIFKTRYINSYGGLIEPNTRPFGNKLSRLVTVVETRPPIIIVGEKLTKLLGGYHA